MSKKIFTGKVISNKMSKTVVVKVEIHKVHPIYLKPVRNSKKFMARDELGVKIGDIVKIEESVPYSKNVNWKVVENLSVKDEK